MLLKKQLTLSVQERQQGIPKNLTFAAKGFKMMNRVVPMMEAKRTAPKRIDNQTLPSSPLSSVSCSTGQSFSDRDFRKKNH